MSKAIRVTNLFTGKTVIYEDAEAFRKDAERRDRDLSGIAGMLAKARDEGRSTDTYEWLLGVRVEDAKDSE